MKKIILITLFLFSSTLLAETPPTSVSGEIELAQDEKKVNQVELHSAEAVEVFKALQTAVENYQSGDVKKITTAANPEMNGKISDQLMQYISIMYLNCLIDKGVCKDILDSILEIDLINSKTDDKVSCSNMLRFWKSWLDNDMEKRHQLNVKIAQVNDINAFNTSERKIYTKCKDTLTGIIEADAQISAADFYKKRYEKAKSFTAKATEYYNASKESSQEIYRKLKFKVQYQ